MAAPVRLLTFTTLYPSASRPRHGIFVETRLRHILATGTVEATVLAPVPWFPSKAAVFGEYGAIARTPKLEHRNGIQVLHPRYLMLPKVGMGMQPFSLALTAERAIRALNNTGLDFDLIDAHYFYPDGVAAAMVAKRLQKPVVITARGSDINLIAQYGPSREAILAAAQAARSVIAVSQALKQAMIDLGMEAGRITVLRNGVDLDLFRPIDRDGARRSLGLTASHVFVSVGNLVPEKAHDIFVRALAMMPGAEGLIVGAGPERPRLVQLIEREGLAAHVRIMEPMAQDQLRAVYSAASALMLTSTREGWPNVLLESMACGTPVVAADVGGVREVVNEPVAGRIVRNRDPAAFARAAADLLTSMPERAAVRRHAEAFSWHEVVRQQVQLFREAVCRRLCPAV